MLIESKILRKAVVGVSVSIVILLVIMAVFNIKISDIASIGLYPFIYSALASIIAIVIKGFRLIALTRNYNVNISFRDGISVRVASEFIALTSLAFVGDETFRFGWLLSRGVDKGRALWIAYAEIFFDVIIGASIAILSSIYIALYGDITIGLIVGLVAISTLTIHTLFVILSEKGKIKIPNIISRIIKRILGQRGEKILNLIDETIIKFSESAREIFNSASIGTILVNVVVTIATAILNGISLLILLNAVGINLDIVTSTLIVYGVLSIASIPISIGGSGLAELGSWTILTAITHVNPWGAILVWRITNYYIPLILSGLTLAIILIRIGGKT